MGNIFDMNNENWLFDVLVTLASTTLALWVLFMAGFVVYAIIRSQSEVFR
jgi:hypothetical protein